jgi:predicted exporter
MWITLALVLALGLLCVRGRWRKILSEAKLRGPTAVALDLIIAMLIMGGIGLLMDKYWR